MCKGYKQWMCHLLEFWGMTPVHPLSYVLVLEYQVSGHCGCTGIHYFYKWRVDRVLLLKFTGSGAYVITVQGHVHAYSWLLFMHLQGRHKSVLYTHTLVLSCWLSHGVVKSLLPSLPYLHTGFSWLLQILDFSSYQNVECTCPLADWVYPVNTGHCVWHCTQLRKPDESTTMSPSICTWCSILAAVEPSAGNYNPSLTHVFHPPGIGQYNLWRHSCLVHST